MRRILLAAGVLVVVGLFGGFVSLGMSVKPPAQQEVQKELPASRFAAEAPPPPVSGPVPAADLPAAPQPAATH